MASPSLVLAPSPAPRSLPDRLLDRPVLVLSTLCLILFVYGIGSGPLHRTETLRASLAQEMMRTGNYLAPTLYRETFLTKPPLMYLAIIATSLPFGEVTPLSARLPSVLAACASVFLFYGFFAHWLGRRGGLLAAVLLPMSLLWLDRVPSAEIDMLQLFWVSASLLCFLRAFEYDGSTRGEYGWTLLAMLAMGGGLLTKWTAPGFFYLTIVPFLWWRGRLRWLWSGPHLLGLGVVVAVVGGWVVAVVAQVGFEPLRETVMREALLRLSPTHHPRPYPWLEVVTFPATMLLAMLPGAGLALWVSRPSFSESCDERTRGLWQLLLCWGWVNLLFWSVAPGHRPRHCLPLQPAFAGLAVLAWVAWWRGRLSLKPTWLTPPRLLGGMLVLWLVVKVVHSEVVVPARQRATDPVPTGQRLGRLVPSGATLHIVGLKDDGILFYSRRRAHRLTNLRSLDKAGAYVLLTEAEWTASRSRGLALHRLASLRDAQGDPLVLATSASVGRRTAANRPRPGGS